MDGVALPPPEVLLESLPDAVLFLDGGGTVMEAAARYAELGGWTKDALLGSAVVDLFPGAQGRELDAQLRRWWSEGASPVDGTVLRLRLVTPHGDDLPVSARIRLGPDCFCVTVRRLDPSAGDLRAALLDAMSTPVVTASAVAGAGASVGRSFAAWDLASVWVLDAPTSTLRAVSVWERDPDPDRCHRSATLRQPFLVGEGLPGRTWQAGDVLVVEGVDGDPRFGPGYGSNRRPRCGALIPLRSGEQIVGVAELLSYAEIDPTLWLASERDAVEFGLGQLVQHFRERLQAHAAEGRLGLALDAGELGVWTLDVRSGRAEWSPRMAELHGVDELEGGADALFATVVTEDRRIVGGALERARAVDEPQTVEYRVHDTDRGTCWLSTRLARVQTNGGPPLLSAVSSDITERKRAELSAQRRRAAIEGLQWVSQAIIAGRRLRDTAVAVAHAATGVLGAELGVVLYPEPGEVGSELAWAVSGLPGDEPAPQPPLHLEMQSVVGTATGVEALGDLRRAPTARRFVEDLGLPVPTDHLRSALLVPVGGERGRPLGLMVFLHRDARYFSEHDARLAASIGSSTGVAIENAHRHEQQRLAAMAFQRQLLPRSEVDIPGVDLCVRYHPGRDGLDVGGDWYDVIRLDEHRLGLAVGDVCGHGVTAAAHMGQLRYSFRALVQSSTPPDEALQVLNQQALEELGTTATLAYVELDTRSGDGRLWRCGHLPPAVVDPAGRDVRWLDDTPTCGPMLGFLRHLDVHSFEFSLEADEVLLLYTDGLIERRRESIDEGLERLDAALRRGVMDLARLCDTLHATLAVVGPEADDAVLLALRRG